VIVGGVGVCVGQQRQHVAMFGENTAPHFGQIHPCGAAGIVNVTVDGFG